MCKSIFHFRWRYRRNLSGHKDPSLRKFNSNVSWSVFLTPSQVANIVFGGPYDHFWPPRNPRRHRRGCSFLDPGDEESRRETRGLSERPPARQVVLEFCSRVESVPKVMSDFCRVVFFSCLRTTYGDPLFRPSLHVRQFSKVFPFTNRCQTGKSRTVGSGVVRTPVAPVSGVHPQKLSNKNSLEGFGVSLLVSPQSPGAS